MPAVDRIWGILRQFRWWTLVVAVGLSLVVWQWLDGLAGPPPPVSPASLAIGRSLPGPMPGLVLNLGNLDCQTGSEASLVIDGEFRLPQVCRLALEYENTGGAVAGPDGEDCGFDPREFIVLIDRRGRHHSPADVGCPPSSPAWPADVGGRMPASVNFNLAAEAAADRLLVAGQLIDFDRPGRVEPPLAVGEPFGDGRGAVGYTVTGFNCRQLIDADSSEVGLWWRRLTNDVNNDRYNPDRNLTLGKVKKNWQVCRLAVDYRNQGGEDWIWRDSCRLAVYRRSRLIDDRGRQHLALADHVCQPQEAAWQPGGTGSEEVEFLVGRLVQIERILVAGQLVDPARKASDGS